MHREPEQRVYKCDRCKGFFAYEQKHADAGHPHDPDARNVIEQVIPAQRGILGYNPTDLCGVCMVAYRKFLRLDR